MHDQFKIRYFNNYSIHFIYSSQRSIVEQAIDQAFCDKDLIAHNWLLVVALYLLMHGNVRSIKPSMLFDTKVRFI